jgi:hypothetical protein
MLERAKGCREVMHPFATGTESGEGVVRVWWVAFVFIALRPKRTQQPHCGTVLESAHVF